MEVKRLDVSGVEVAPLSEQLRVLAPDAEYQEKTAPAGSVMLRYVDGQLEAADRLTQVARRQLGCHLPILARHAAPARCAEGPLRGSTGFNG